MISPFQSARPAQDSQFRSPIPLLVGIAAACTLLCAGCQDNAATGFHEYSGNGNSSEHLVPQDDAKPGDPKRSNTAESNTDTRSGEKVPSKPNEPATTVAAPKVSQQTKAVADAPVAAPKPLAVNPAATKSALGSPTMVADAPRRPKVLIPDRQFQAAGPEGAVRVSYDDIDLLKVLNMEPVTPDALAMMPAWLKSLEGKRVRLRGFMFPANSQTGLAGFSLARDNQICCFVRKPKVYDVFPVKLRDGVTTDYIANRPIDVVGVFHFMNEPEDWPVYGMYYIEDAIIVDKR